MLETISILINAVLVLAIIFVIYAYLLPPLIGAPFVPTKRSRVSTMIALAKIRAGERACDLGSGDGRIVIALAQAGAEAHGYEINPMLVLHSRLLIRRHGLSGRAHIHWKSFLKLDCSGFDVVTIYGLPGIMKRLEEKLRRELPEGGRVISHAFRFPNWPAEEQEDKVYVYRRS